MTRHASASILVGILALAGALPLAAAAALIEPVSVARSATASTAHPSGTPDAHTVTSSAFDGSIRAQARSVNEAAFPANGISVENSQGSFISAANILVTLNGYAYHELFADTNGTFALSSDYDLVFDLTEPSQYLLASVMTTPAGSTLHASLFDADGDLLAQDLVNTFGVLEIGQYRFHVAFERDEQPGQQLPGPSTDYPGKHGAYAQLTFAAIPEPGTAALLVLGLVLVSRAAPSRSTPTRRARRRAV